MRVGASVTPSIGSTSIARIGSRSRSASSTGAGSPSSGRPSSASSARGASVTSKAGWRSPIACSSGAIFSSALSPIFGIEAWPATPSVRQREAKDALLGDAHAVDALAAEGDDGARALVEQVCRSAPRRGGARSDPLRALAAAGLLVDDDDDEQVAAGRAPARARERQRRRRPRPRSGTSCPARRGPRARRRRRRPTTGRAATRPASASTVSTCESRHSVGPSPRAAQARDEVGALLGAAQQLDLEARRRRSRPASSSWAARSSPGGLTVLKRTRRWSSSVVSRSRSSAIAPRLRHGLRRAVAMPATSSTAAMARTSCDLRQAPGQPRADERAGDRRRAPSRRPSSPAARTGRWPMAPEDADPEADGRRSSPRARAGRSPTILSSAGMRSEPRMRPTTPPSSPMSAPAPTAAAMSRSGSRAVVGPARRRRPARRGRTRCRAARRAMTPSSARARQHAGQVAAEDRGRRSTAAPSTRTAAS